jgi:DNA-binding HxlR family transcriptional regulator
MTRQSFADVDCGVAQAAQQIGDKWTLVILRDAFNGVNRYDDFARHLGVASNVLAARLSALVDADILYRRPVAADGRAVEYKLTPKGLALYPLIVFLHQWGDRWMPKTRGKRLEVVDRQTLRPVREVQVHDADGQPLTARDTRSRIGRGGSDVMRHLQSVVAQRQRGPS